MRVETILNQLVTDEKEVYYLMLAGNAGDTLISAGFFQLAARCGLAYTVISPGASVPPYATVIVNGGGGLVPEWATAKEAIEFYRRAGNELILMPQSIRDNGDLLARLDGSHTIFLREFRSLEHVKNEVSTDVTLHFDHDTAFSINIENLFRTNTRIPIRTKFSPKNLIRHSLMCYLHLRSLFTKDIKAFRVDNEARNGSKGSLLIYDLSLVASFGSATEAECFYTAKRFLSVIDRYRTIETNRLHVAIGGALLGKNVTLYDNSYFKCRAVYEASMSSYTVRMEPA